MLILQNIAYTHPNKDLLFNNINLNLNEHDKIALTGNNGTGKSTLLRIIAGELQPANGRLGVTAKAYYVPQIFGQYDHLTIAGALKVEEKLNALRQILAGDATDLAFTILNDDWTIEERCKAALELWQLNAFSLETKLEELSGGQKTKLFLAGIAIHQPGLILMDEPSNHLDVPGRQLLYDLIESTKHSLIVVSHDRKLLNLINTVCELGKTGIAVYGGNYDFYVQQKQLAGEAAEHEILDREKTIRKAKEKERAALERRERSDARGKKKQEKAGVARIMMNTLRNKAENSTSKMKAVHNEKLDLIGTELQALRDALPGIDKMKFGFDNSALHKGRTMFTAQDMNVRFNETLHWKEGLNFQITSGERIAFMGSNGAGKTTLLRLLLGELVPATGTISRADTRPVYIDQDYSLLNKAFSVYMQAQQFNDSALQEHEIKIRLNRFLFTKDDWNKPCSVLSGGERMRLSLCCLTISSQSPDLIILDEPTNNLDIQNVAILTAAINEYQGTLLVVSHDEDFLKEVNIDRTINLS